jgi:ABC-type transport system involved in multi-copper enzyme maturation permease subunit
MSTLVLQPASTAIQVHDVRLRRVVASEWVKLWSLRSTVLTLLAAVSTMVLIGCLAAWAFTSNWDDLDPVERAAFNPIDPALVGVNLAQLAVGVLGVLLITGEYATGMIRATLAAVPTRLPVLWAKTGLYAGVVFVLMSVTSLVAFLMAQLFLGERGADLSVDGLPRALLGTAGYLTAIAVLAVALGFLLRSTAGGIATLFGLLLVVPTLGLLLPSSWRDTLLPYLPSYAGSAVTTVRPQDDLLSPTGGALVLLAWALVPLLAAAASFRRRDA